MKKFLLNWGKNFLFYDFIFTLILSLALCIIHKYNLDLIQFNTLYVYGFVFAMNLFFGYLYNVNIYKMLDSKNPRIEFLKKSEFFTEIKHTMDSFDYYLRTIFVLGLIGIFFGNANFIYLFFVATMLIEARLLRCVWIKNKLFEILVSKPFKDDKPGNINDK